MDMMRPVIDSMDGGQWWRFVVFFFVVLGSFIVGKIVQSVLKQVSKRYGKRKRLLAEASFTALSRSSVYVVFVLGLGLAFDVLTIPEPFHSWVVIGVKSVLFTLSLGYVGYCLVDVLQVWMSERAEQTANRLDDMLVPLTVKSLRITIYALVFVEIAQSLSGRSVSSILAALGIGGVAVALASKDTVSNLFGSLVLCLDKPFALGDRIKAGGETGFVEDVGFRSTRFRTLDGTLIIIPNGQLANMTIENVQQRPFLKRSLTVRVTYDSSPEKMKQAVEIIRAILNKHEGMDEAKPPRIYFTDFGDWALQISVTYWYCPPEYWDWQAFNEKVNMEILTQFNAAGIHFAFPSRTLYHQGVMGCPVEMSKSKG